ncbi:cysteine--tRNA ligase [Marinilactibacillus sp. Marseille-P9653]|uniref:cysteine--tRNA ligase n=1 Tax=Marinilactibacillus sp. Marseille-P9653 TaxID=2866583 RepID=UPI001CE45F17|nr:cysteine--tRNA ligase [Marinilactibacillus sp. Marseille-P9653]
MIELYNTLSNQKERFEPLQENKVSMYVCGPTVYNYIHIGNARSTVAFDTIRRYFEYRGYEVNYVSNFTDVDDKIIKAAEELKLTAPEVADRFIEAYYEDTEALHVKRATHAPRVMDNIQEIIQFIEVLIEKGFAYQKEGDVYYRTRKFEGYGKLSGISVDDLELGASNRLEESENMKKDDPLDFALWKSAKREEISWTSPWGEGRPGWHIECSVMATKYLGDTIDIHAGGQDLTFPHHENEIAQSEAKTGEPFAKYWLHNGFVTMNEEKMSKSLGNFVLVHDLKKIHDPQVLRFFLSTVHYRHPINYTDETIHEAKSNLTRIQTAYANASHRIEQAEDALEDDASQIQKWKDLIQQFEKHMDDDFQAQNGITDVYEMIRNLNVYLEQKQVSKKVLAFAMKHLEEILAIFGIQLDLVIDTELLDKEVEELIEERNQSRKDKNFARADEIRDLLQEKGILLEDTPQGIRWKRKES